MTVNRPTRDVLARMAGNDHRSVKFLEDLANAAIPTGGTIGQALVKTGTGDWATGWATVSGGGGGGVTDGDKGDVTVSGTGTVWTIDAGVVTLAKMANLAADRIVGRASTIGAPQALTGSQVTLMLDTVSAGSQGAAPASGGGTANYLRADGTWAAPAASAAWGGITGTLSAQTDLNTALAGKLGLAGGTMTGLLTTTAAVAGGAGFNIGIGVDPTSPVNGDIWATALALHAQINSTTYHFAFLNGSSTFTGKKTFSASVAGNAFLNLAHGVAPTSPVNGDFWTTTSGAFAQINGATVNLGGGGGGVSDGDKGDVVVSGTGTVWTVDANVVDNTKLAQIATARIKGRVTAATGNHEDLTGTQATTLLDPFTSALKGLVPASGGGTANFMRADGTWAAPPGADYAWCSLAADYALTNSTASQKLFNTTSNGALTLATGRYRFTCWMSLSGMSATSGNIAWDLLGTGTAVLARIYQISNGRDSSALTAAASTAGSNTKAIAAPVVTAGTGTALLATISGTFDVTTGGTIIPSIALTTASAASALTGTYFEAIRIGATGATSQGSWS